jgi:hypothetical protein
MMTRVRSLMSPAPTELLDGEELVGTGGQAAAPIDAIVNLEDAANTLGDVVDRVVRKVLVACDAHASHIRLALASLQ